MKPDALSDACHGRLTGREQLINARACRGAFRYLMSLIRPEKMGRGALSSCNLKSGSVTRSRMEQRLLYGVSLCVPLDFSQRFYTPPFVSLTVSTALQEPQTLELYP